MYLPWHAEVRTICRIIHLTVPYSAVSHILGGVPSSALQLFTIPRQTNIPTGLIFAIVVDSDNHATRAATDRLRNQMLTGSGTGQTQLSCDHQVDLGRHQIALTQEAGPLSADAKKLKLGDVLQNVQKTTDALAQTLGRTIGEKRHAPSKQIRTAIAECVSVFNAVHNDLEWFVAKTSPGPDRDRFVALLEPLEQLLARNESTSEATPTP